ncbi:MAG TPA: TatD family hydrolase [Ignavibacteria bacterium]|jgi:TatD DNase family protein
MFVDTHAHLNYPELKSSLPDILKRAADNGVEKIIVPATSYKTSLEITELIQKHEMLYGAVGIHPTELNDFEEKQLHEIESLAKENKIVAIGEIGLDYYWEPYDKALEHHVLKSQLEIAKRSNLPVILHNRKSSEDLMKIVESKFENGKLKGQFHSFSGDEEMAKKCVEMGFYISFTGNITYKPKDHTYIAYQIVRETPIENLLLETDTPYLPPVPYRGKQNEPSYIKHTAEKLAELKGISIEELAKTTSENAIRLFNL